MARHVRRAEGFQWSSLRKYLSTPLLSLLPRHLYHAPHHHTDALFPTMYLVLVLMTSLYGKRGRDLCASLYLRQQTCNDMQGFIVLPIFVETVSLPTPYYQILRSRRLRTQTRSLIPVALPSFATFIRNLNRCSGDLQRPRSCSSFSRVLYRKVHASFTHTLRIISHRATGFRSNTHRYTCTK